MPSGQSGPSHLRQQAKVASLDQRRLLAMERYGLQPHPDDPSRSLQYVVSADGSWSMSCLACHQGQVAGQVVPGPAQLELCTGDPHR